MLRVDAHHHLWRYNDADFDWLQGPLSALRKDFLPVHFVQEAERADVRVAVAVQARQNLQETDWLLAVASEQPLVQGVVGWLPLRDPSFASLLERYRARPSLKGLRHIVQAEPAGFMDESAFRAGIAALGETGLVYDILIQEHQLEEAIRLVDRFPYQVFVLDHLAKPRIGAGELQPWANRIRALAQRANVVCKVSGMVTEADPLDWSPVQLKPFFDTVLEAFTPARLMAGSDWPVLLAGCGYEPWWALLDSWTAALSAGERSSILADTAMRIYKLASPSIGVAAQQEEP